jgi:hypothetical protein
MNEAEYFLIGGAGVVRNDMGPCWHTANALIALVTLFMNELTTLAQDAQHAPGSSNGSEADSLQSDLSWEPRCLFSFLRVRRMPSRSRLPVEFTHKHSTTSG